MRRSLRRWWPSMPCQMPMCNLKMQPKEAPVLIVPCGRQAKRGVFSWVSHHIKTWPLQRRSPCWSSPRQLPSRRTKTSERDLPIGRRRSQTPSRQCRRSWASSRRMEKKQERLTPAAKLDSKPLPDKADFRERTEAQPSVQSLDGRGDKLGSASSAANTALDGLWPSLQRFPRRHLLRT